MGSSPSGRRHPHEVGRYTSYLAIDWVGTIYNARCKLQNLNNMAL